jgi:excisionase family DNA binding protein
VAGVEKVMRGSVMAETRQCEAVVDVGETGKFLGLPHAPRPATSEANDVMTLAEAAALLRVHPVTLRKRAKAWGVPHRRLGAEWRFSRQVLTSWIQKRDAA